VGGAVVTALALTSASLVLAAPSSADPGQPGLEEATQAAYPIPGQGVGGEAVEGPPGEGGPTAGGQGELGEEAGGSPGQPTQQVAGDGAGLPFRGPRRFQRTISPDEAQAT
jgi:hypothetical protein